MLSCGSRPSPPCRRYERSLICVDVLRKTMTEAAKIIPQGNVEQAMTAGKLNKEEQEDFRNLLAGARPPHDTRPHTRPRAPYHPAPLCHAARAPGAPRSGGRPACGARVLLLLCCGAGCEHGWCLQWQWRARVECAETACGLLVLLRAGRTIMDIKDHEKLRLFLLYALTQFWAIGKSMPPEVKTALMQARPSPPPAPPASPDAPPASWRVLERLAGLWSAYAGW